MLDCIAWAPYTQEIHSYFASNDKFVTSLNKVLVVIFLLLFIHSFQVGSSSERFFREPDKTLLKKICIFLELWKYFE